MKKKIKVKIYGAGSIGNHLAYAARRKKWDVTLCDIDANALNRTKEEIFPSRYGKFDENIKLFDLKKDEEPIGGFDWIFVGTPPNTHMEIALKSLDEEPRGIMVEKPLCTPKLEFTKEIKKKLLGKKTKIFVGYDHAVSKSVNYFKSKAKKLTNIKYLDVSFREHWKGIFDAHFWLNGPEDSYLGFWEKGGGSLGEHSHALNLWQSIAKFLNQGKIVKVSSQFKFKKNNLVNYDEIAMLNLETETGFVGNVIQDVVTYPPQKCMRLQAENEALEWSCIAKPYSDNVKIINGTTKTIKFKKSRSDDFYCELDHLEEVIDHNCDSPISFQNGFETMLIIKAAHESYKTGKVVNVDYT